LIAGGAPLLILVAVNLFLVVERRLKHCQEMQRRTT